MALNEDTLVQQTTADYLRDVLGWRSEYAYNSEVLGAGGTFGRGSEQEVVLGGVLERKLRELNPGLPEAAYRDALRQIVEVAPGQGAMAANREKYRLLRDGVKVSFRKPDGADGASRDAVLAPHTTRTLCAPKTGRFLRAPRVGSGRFAPGGHALPACPEERRQRRPAPR